LGGEFCSFKTEILGGLASVFITDCHYKNLCLFWHLQVLWRKRLCRYFQNSRSRRDNTLQVVRIHKQKAKVASTPNQPRSTGSRTVFGVKNYLPERPHGETDETISAMEKMMNTERRKLKPDPTRITELMDSTFADRRQLIVVDKATLPAIQDRFPCLFSEDEVFIRVYCICLYGKCVAVSGYTSVVTKTLDVDTEVALFETEIEAKAVKILP